MKKLLILAMVLGMSCAAFGQVWEIPQGSATIDADLSDWAGATWIPMTVVAYGNPADISNAQMAVRWDPNNIYAALTVDDAALNLSQGVITWNGQDDLEVYINANNDDAAGYNSTGWVSAQQYFVGPNGTLPPPGLSATAGTGTWTDLGSLHPLPSATFPNAEIEIATSVVGPTITYEMRVPAFSDMANGVLQNLAVNDVVGFDIVVADLGSSYGWLGINAVGSKFANASAFQDWTLVPEPSTMVLLGLGAVVLLARKKT